MANQDKQVSALDKQLMALKLRKAGVSYLDIANQLGYRGVSGAHAAVKAGLKRTLQEPADELRNLELERLDSMLMGVWQQATQGNQGAIDRALRIMERRAKLLGLDAPTKQDFTSGGDPIKIQFIDVVRNAGDNDDA